MSDKYGWMDENHRLWSLYRFLMQIHKAKKDYYRSGTSKLTDQEYDSLESSFKVLHGEDSYKELVGVGYREGSYEKYRDLYKKLTKTRLKRI